MVLDIAAKVFKETHVGENSCGEKARSSSPLCLKCDYCNRMGHFVYTFLPYIESLSNTKRPENLTSEYSKTSMKRTPN